MTVSSSFPPPRFVHMDNIPLNFLFPRLTTPSSLGSQVLQFLTHLHARCTRCTLVKSIHFFYWNTQCWTQLFMALPVLSRGVTCLDLMKTPVLMQSRIILTFFSARVYCWLLDSFLPTVTPNVFSVELPSSSLAPVCTGAWGYSSFTKVQDVFLTLVEFHGSSAVPFLQPAQVHLDSSMIH